MRDLTRNTKSSNKLVNKKKIKRIKLPVKQNKVIERRRGENV